jgi:CheY-like chemotaxis protein
MARILITDDSAASRAIVSRLIGEAHEIGTASSGAEAIAAAATGAFDLLLLDLLMPDMDGPEVIRELRARGLDLPIVVMSADIQESTRAQVLSLGANAMVPKPLSRVGLMTAIEAALGGRPARSDAARHRGPTSDS